MRQCTADATSARDIADKISLMMTDDSLRATVPRAKGMRHAREYRWDRSAQKLLDILYGQASDSIHVARTERVGGLIDVRKVATLSTPQCAGSAPGAVETGSAGRCNRAAHAREDVVRARFEFAGGSRQAGSPDMIGTNGWAGSASDLAMWREMGISWGRDSVGPGQPDSPSEPMRVDMTGVQYNSELPPVLLRNKRNGVGSLLLLAPIPPTGTPAYRATPNPRLSMSRHGSDMSMQ